MKAFMQKAAGLFGGNAANKLSGKKDYLEALCSGTIFAASADGKIDDSELDKGLRSITSIPGITDAYSEHDIAAELDKRIKQAQGGRMGRRGLLKEMEDLKDADVSMREAIILVALDEADDNGMGDEERAANITMGQALKIDAAKLI